MDIKEIKELIDIVVQNGLESLEVTEQAGGVKIKMPAAQAECGQQKPQAMPPQVVEQAAGVGENELDFNNLKHITAPMVGVFYAAPSPDSPAFVKIGDKIRKGDVLCIIESMKLMNEITAEQDGEIVDICVENGQVVEYAQILFKIF